LDFSFPRFPIWGLWFCQETSHRNRGCGNASFPRNIAQAHLESAHVTDSTHRFCYRADKVLRGLKSTYRRHGTLNLFAALEVDTGHVHTRFTEYKKREDFRGFLDSVLADQPQDKEIHVILDNYSTHKRNDDWLAKYEGRVRFHFTPTSASWLNQIEIVFSLLQRKTLNGGSFGTKDQLREAIEAFFRRHNERAKPFRWRKREVKGSQLRNTIVNLRN